MLIINRILFAYILHMTNFTLYSWMIHHKKRPGCVPEKCESLFNSLIRNAIVGQIVPVHTLCHL